MEHGWCHASTITTQLATFVTSSMHRDLAPPTAYQLQSMGFPPKQLLDPSQTIEQAGLANSVVIQRL
ncbi:unnamed protein product [Rhodiola kirilowii]